MRIEFRNAITADEVNEIRRAMGWRRNHPEQVQAGLDGSALVVAAYEAGKAVGMARLSWDGGGGAKISDMLIVPEFRSQGLESKLIERVLDFLREKLKPGFGIQVDIRAWGNQAAQYEGLGFVFSTPQMRGTPMHICLTDQIELTDRLFKQCGYAEK